LGREKQPLKQQPILSNVAPPELPIPGAVRRQAASTKSSTSSVAVTISRIFNQRSSYQISAYGSRFAVFNKLAVAVIHKANGGGCAV